jgi:hypothetical protein
VVRFGHADTVAAQVISSQLFADTGEHIYQVVAAVSHRSRCPLAATQARSAVIKHKVTFFNTRNGQNRTVPISQSLYEEIMASGYSLASIT